MGQHGHRDGIAHGFQIYAIRRVAVNWATRGRRTPGPLVPAPA
jgi:hypothetical protein